MRSIPRRMFLKQGGLALLSMGLPPAFMSRSLLAETAGGARRKTLVCVFQRGAVDGLSMVVPFGEGAYYDVRRSIAIPAPSAGLAGAALDLDGFFGLHPALEPVLPLWREGELAIVQACGSPHPTRSHFEAQDYMESAAPGDSARRDGWLNRALTETVCEECAGRTLADGAAHAADHATGQVALAGVADPLRGVAIGAELPLALRGDHPALPIADLERMLESGATSALTALYRDAGDLIAGAADESVSAVERLRRADPLQYRPRAGVEYPRVRFGRAMMQVAQLVKADVGLEVAFVDIDGWDTHRGQGGSRGRLAGLIGDMAGGLRAFHDDLGDRMEDVIVLTMSEFGRTVDENGTGGTDHGHGNCMMAFGGGVRGGRIVGRWPGLDRDALYEGRDLAITTDFRDVFGELAATHLGAARSDRIFPGYALDPSRRPGLLGA
ncbi:MAG TPA: DUF1501 domain-containing protein [Gemmatimonadota bacterium]|nr:DUF1501 domain-containing protein [Gemmatimonadota bacterium]